MPLAVGGCQILGPVPTTNPFQAVIFTVFSCGQRVDVGLQFQEPSVTSCYCCFGLRARVIPACCTGGPHCNKLMMLLLPLLLLCRYAFNIIFNILNKSSLNAFPCPWFISAMQLSKWHQPGREGCSRT
jgi:hypothetical protein